MSKKKLFFKQKVGDIPLGNIISEWKYNGNVLDTVGVNDGIATNINYVSGLINQEAVFNEINNSNVVIPNNNDLSFGNGFTDVPFSISLMCYPFNWVTDSGFTGAYFINKRSQVDGLIVEWQFVYANNFLDFQVFDYNNSNQIRFRVSITLPIMQYLHLIGTYDGNGNSSIYYQGVPQTVVPNFVGSYTAMDNLGITATIGKASWRNDFLEFNGRFASTRIWNVELTANQANEIATKELAGIDINP